MRLAVFSALALCLFLVGATPASAADVDGKWTGSIDAGQGPIDVGFTFKADGSKLTGSTIGPDGMEVAIKEGKIEGNNLTFKISLDFGGMPFELNYKGVMTGTDMKLTIDFMGMPIEMNVKKAK
jgi:opacity protein-like surface antigen